METLTIRHLPEEMEQLPVDPENLNRVLLSGLFEEKAKTAEGERPFYTFIPENLEYDQQCLVIAPPAQADIPEFLESSGLRQFAEEKQLFLFFLKAEDGKWDLSGKDAAYMNAVYGHFPDPSLIDSRYTLLLLLYSFLLCPRNILCSKIHGSDMQTSYSQTFEISLNCFFP